MGKKKFFHPFFLLLLVEGEERECLPKFGVLIFILAHETKQFYSQSWKHCIQPGACCTSAAGSRKKVLKGILAV